MFAAAAGEDVLGGVVDSEVEENLLEMLEIHELRRGMLLPSPLIFSVELARDRSPGLLDCCLPALVGAGGVGGVGWAVVASRVAADSEGGVTAPGNCDCLFAWLPFVVGD